MCPRLDKTTNPGKTFIETFRPLYIVLIVTYLHFKYLFFNKNTLSSIINSKHRLPRIVTRENFATLRKINRRITKIFNILGAPNEFCLKSSAIIAMCTMHLGNVHIVIGVDKNSTTEGHAWVEHNTKIISEDSQASLQKYEVIKRIEFRT